MDINDYIIPQDGLDWSVMLKDWHWILPASFEIWIVNRFADLIIVKDDDSVWLLDTSSGRFEKIADSRDHFADQADDEDTFSKWFMAGAVDELVAAGHTLGSKQCYSYKLPPGLGGEYALANYMVADIHVHLSMHGQIFFRTKDLPEGTPVSFSQDPGQPGA